MKPSSHVNHPEWSHSANIYEVNLRQFTPEGTLNAFAAHLPRLKAIGVDILWLMPINPIGKLNRKGTLGSYYAVSDYLSVNPEFGTLEDLKRLVAEAHTLGMYLIIDWVANHTAWDHPWIEQHPDWYQKNRAGEIVCYQFNNGKEQEEWSDVVGLDYQVPELWQAMSAALEYWVREADIDGYRCDVAGLLPTPFWEQLRTKLEKIKPVFMLAEWDGPELHQHAFDMSYDWDLYDTLSEILAGQADARALQSYVAQQALTYPDDAYRMLFTTNHDKNSWVADDVERYGDAFKACAVLAATLPGMPLLYNGQESVLDRRIAFFDRDPIEWRDYPLADFYQWLFALKKAHPALWNGSIGGTIKLSPLCDAQLFAFHRSLGDDQVRVMINLSTKEYRSSEAESDELIKLPPWGYQIDLC